MSDISLPHQTPTTLGSWVLLVAQVIESYGLDSDSLLEENGIILNDIKENDSRCPTALMANVWQMLATKSHDPYVAIRMARYFKPTAYSALGLTMAASPTVHDALMRFSRYSSLIGDAIQVSILEHDDNIKVLLNPHLATNGQSSIYDISSTLCCLYSVLSEVSTGNLRVKEVHFKQSLPSSKPLEGFFSCPVIFGSNYNQIVFNKHDVYTKQHVYHTELIDSLDSWIETHLHNIRQGKTSNKVTDMLVKHLNKGEFSQHNIARSLAMSTRKLQRKLNEEGTNYTELLNDYRKKLAIELIIKDALPLSEVSCLLGFNNQSNFTRAFKRWTGTTPNQYPQ